MNYCLVYIPVIYIASWLPPPTTWVLRAVTAGTPTSELGTALPRGGAGASVSGEGDGLGRGLTHGHIQRYIHVYLDR